MAYKMAPKGGNNAKTGHGIPMTFRQDGPKQMKFIKDTASKIGSAISSANEAGQKAYDKSSTPTSFWGGSGAKRSYEKNPVEYIRGFANNIMSDEPATRAPKKSAGKGPHQEKKKVAPKKAAPKKEKGFLDTVSDYASGAVESVKGALKKGDDYLRKLEGPSGDSRYGDVGDTMFGVKLSGNNAGSYDATKNPMSSEYKKKGPRQMVKGAVKKTSMPPAAEPKASKKKGSVAKMKKC